MTDADFLADLREPVEAKLVKAQEALTAAEQVAHEAREVEKDRRDDVRTLETILKRIDGEPLRRDQRPRSDKRNSVSEARKDAIVKAIKSLGSDGGTVSEIVKAMGLGEASNSSVRDGINVLRTEERVRLADYRQRPNGGGRGSNVYTLLDG